MSALTFFSLFAVLPAVTLSTLVNRTIDDADAAYFKFNNSEALDPPRWAAVTPSTPCDYCSASPQANLTHNETWHDGSNASSGSFTFIGTAVYIYGVDLAGSANISFTVEDPPIKTFHRYTGTVQFTYNAVLFSAEGMTNGNHTVSWTLSKDAETNGTVALFDYAVITVDDSSPSPTTPSSSSKSHAGAIAGGVVGGLVALVLIAFGVFCFLRRRRRTAASSPDSPSTPSTPDMIQPFVSQTRSPTSAVVLAPLRGGGVAADRSRHASGSASGSGSGESPTSAIGNGKTLNTSWTSPSSSSLHISTAAFASAPSPIATSPERDRVTLAPTMLSATATGTLTPQFLEDRLAQLEAHVRELTVDGPGAPPAYYPEQRRASRESV
ncbi:hypothetical protein MKEN_00404200 [Mycena kentingensis (nom. inval.)]|nr:hypothetical protein MKEN_00404200 [Mycena kentingensis (nom. inval.)]